MTPRTTRPPASRHPARRNRAPRGPAPGPRTPRSRATVAGATALLAAALATQVAPMAAADTDDPDLEQTVESDEAILDGDIVVTDGHVDVGPRLLDGEWTMLARDDREVPSVWRDPARTVMHLDDAAILPAPSGTDFEFLGVEPGTPLHVVPQTQDPDVVWLGWNTQDPHVVDAVEQGATLQLDRVDGPGDVFVFLQEGVTGPPHVLWNSGEPLPQELWMEVNTHVHANWVFTEPGTYLLDVTMRADLTDGTTARDRGTLLFAIGADTDPDEALAAAADLSPDPGPREPSASATASARTDAARVPDGRAGAPSSDRDIAPLWWAMPAGLLLVLGLVLQTVRARRARSAADRDVEDQR